MSENDSCKEIEIMFGGAPSQTSAARTSENKPTRTVFLFFQKSFCQSLFALYGNPTTGRQKNVDFEMKERRLEEFNFGETNGIGHR